MGVNIPLRDGDPAIAPFFQSTQEALVGIAHNVRLSRENTNTIRLAAAAGDGRAVLSIDGKLRWRESNLDVAHPGGSAGTWYVWATTAANDFTGPPGAEDATVYAFGLRIHASATVAPTGAGIAHTRLIGSLEWDGTTIIPGSVRTLAGVSGHGHDHRYDGADAVPTLAASHESDAVQALTLTTSYTTVPILGEDTHLHLPKGSLLLLWLSAYWSILTPNAASNRAELVITERDPASTAADWLITEQTTFASAPLYPSATLSSPPGGGVAGRLFTTPGGLGSTTYSTPIARGFSANALQALFPPGAGPLPIVVPKTGTYSFGIVLTRATTPSSVAMEFGPARAYAQVLTPPDL